MTRSDTKLVALIDEIYMSVPFLDNANCEMNSKNWDIVLDVTESVGS